MQEKIEFKAGNLSGVLENYEVDSAREFSERMSDEDVNRFNEIFQKAKYEKSNSGNYYDKDENSVFLKEISGDTVFHESTHWLDFNHRNFRHLRNGQTCTSG